MDVECGRTKPIDYDALEKAWELGDDQHELTTEGDEHFRQLGDRNAEEIKMSGPQMIFVTLKKGHNEPLTDVASRWKEMLWNGGVDVNIYQVDDSKLLIGLQKGIFVNEIMTFLHEQQDVKEYEWNSKSSSSENRQRYNLKRLQVGPKKTNTQKVPSGYKLSKTSDGKTLSSNKAKTLKDQWQNEL
ncbi:Mesoderm development candidate 2 [Plasmopara halstedii]|uniref:Mesoderm development candidate 2 n=1 Tax=Plasmopara halstedii TaxID=4781 RepID=A0A0P1AXN2_PLAHL|nr:Mesoderm development candidate 2 [Plasmopara halstedii]CEG47212.1 Mesoderm development candidate 2 [Plasmopara halstedii]|eukprot:XP_024583581.1 Mesoderm development candidate 2 [Plasmopara halstedii]